MNAMPEIPSAIVITRNLPPLIGGMERLVWHIVDELRRDYHVHVIGPAGCGLFLHSSVTVTEVPVRPMFGYLLRTKLAGIRHALRLRPRIVFAGSGLTAPLAWLAARLSGARCVAYLHGLDVEAKHRLYRALWHPFFRHCDKILVNSRFTKELASTAGIAIERIAILHPGVELPDLNQAVCQRADFRARHSLNGDPIMLYVGRITPRKGLAAFVREILPRIADSKPDAKLVVIGDEPTEAIHVQAGEHRRVTDALETTGLGDRVIFLKNVPDDVLRSAYFAADVLVFPVQERPNDHEGFGMVAIEAAAHGLPTVAFAVGGVTDAVIDGQTGMLIAPGDNDQFSRAVLGYLGADYSAKDDRSANIRASAAPFAWPAFGKRLKELCSDSLD